MITALHTLVDAEDPEDEPWGVSTQLRIPGAGTMMLYQPCDPPAMSL